MANTVCRYVLRCIVHLLAAASVCLPNHQRSNLTIFKCINMCEGVSKISWEQAKIRQCDNCSMWVHVMASTMVCTSFSSLFVWCQIPCILYLHCHGHQSTFHTRKFLSNVYMHWHGVVCGADTSNMLLLIIISGERKWLVKINAHFCYRPWYWCDGRKSTVCSLWYCPPLTPKYIPHSQISQSCGLWSRYFQHASTNNNTVIVS